MPPPIITTTTEDRTITKITPEITNQNNSTANNNVENPLTINEKEKVDDTDNDSEISSEDSHQNLSNSNHHHNHPKDYTTHGVGNLHEIAGHSHDVAHAINDDTDAVKDIGTLILELGILVHSVIIGLALGVSTSEFDSLIIAICFHQLFEGIALGTRIAELRNVKTLCKKLGLGFAYPITTPLGIAIGIGIRFSYNPESYVALLFQGILDSLSAGILIYNAYVELIAIEMNHNNKFRALSMPRKLSYFAAMYIGAAAMAIIGIWA